jgi:hypothetical protein
MKNNILIWASVLITIITLNACTKSIDETRNWDSIPAELIFEDPALIELFVTNFYAMLPDKLRSPYYTEEGCGTSGSIFGPLTGRMETSMAGWVENNFVDNNWKQLRSINEFFANIDKTKANFSVGQKDWLKGQAYFFRAYIYYLFVETYGGVAIIKDVKSPTAPLSELDLPRNSSLECFDFIKGQLDSAIMFLPARGTKGYGAYRVDKIAAMALKSKAFVLKACPRFCNTKVDKYWQEAYDVVMATKTEAIAEGFTLFEDGTEKPFANMFFPPHTARNKEFLFYIAFSYPGRTTGNGKEWGPGQGGKWRPCWQAIQAYRMANGKEITDPTSGYDESLFWVNREPRFYANINYNGAPFTFPDYPANTRQWFFNGSPNGTGTAVTGFSLRKFSSMYLTKEIANQSEDDLALIRYAELLLWQAECANEIGKPSEALDQLKLIRKRARIDIGADGRYGLAAGVGTDYQVTLRAIYRERQTELFMEGQRFWDYANRRNFQELRDIAQFTECIPDLDKTKFNALKFRKRGTKTILTLGNSVNWTDVTNALDDSLGNTSPAIANQIIKDLSKFVRKNWDVLSTNAIIIPDTYYFAPIFQGDIDKSPAIKQNIGWVGGTFDPRITQ